MRTVEELRNATICGGQSVLMVIARDLERTNVSLSLKGPLSGTTISYTPEAFVAEYRCLEPISTDQFVADESSIIAHIARTHLILVLPGTDHEELPALLAAFRAAGVTISDCRSYLNQTSIQ